MKKNKVNFKCTCCNSIDIDFNETGNLTRNDIENIKIIEREVIYDCKCNKCGNEYKIPAGIDKYYIFDKEENVDQSDDIKMLLKFETTSCFKKSFSLCSAKISIYDNNLDSDNDIYFILMEDDEYPIFITKETKDEFISDFNKIHSFVYNNWMQRHR